MQNKTDILIIGTVPSTAGIGGVTIHVSRLYEALCKTDVVPTLCDYKVLPLDTQIKMIRQCGLVHLHVSNPYLRFFYVLLCRLLGKINILTFHGNLGRFGALKNFVDRMALRMCDVPVMINESSYRDAFKINQKAVLISAYIPDGSNDELPQELIKVINEHKNAGQSIVSTNASGLNYDSSGNEIYGISFLVDFFKGLNQYFLVVSDPSGQYTKRLGEFPTDNIMIVAQPHSFPAILKYSDVMIRATSTDGDALSIHEALDARVKVVATDCVDRPEGVVCFQYQDSTTLNEALLGRIEKKGSSPQNSSGTVKALYNLYKKLSDER